jgi:hypothetical protein
MMKTLWMFAIWFSTLLSVVQAADGKVHSQPENEPILPMEVNDLKILQRIESESTKLIDAHQITPMSSLLSQTNRAHCQLKLMNPGSRVLTPHQIHNAKTDGVFIVAGLYKCPRCTRWHANTAGAYAITPGGAAVTCFHVLLTSNSVAMVAMNRSGKIFPVTEVLATDPVNDLAIVQLEGSGFTPLAISTNALPGEKVVAISHPDQKFYTLTAGLVSRYAVVRKPIGLAGILDITADFARGSSGCPVFNERGAVIGTICSTESVYYNENAGHRDNLQMVIKHCIPTKALLNLIQPLR